VIGALSTTDSDWFSFSSTDFPIVQGEGAGLDAPGRQVRTRTFKSWNESDIKKIKIKVYNQTTRPRHKAGAESQPK